jgi:hypothetical protein
MRHVGLANRKETVLRPHSGQSLSVEGFAMSSKSMSSKFMSSKSMLSDSMPSKFSIGDKVDQAFSNHAEGTVVAVFKDLTGKHRYAIEMFGHRTIQIASERSLVAHGNPSVQ